MRLILMAVLLMLGACSGQGGDGTPADTLTQRQRDSVIGASRLPGAAGVRGALEASDTAAARRALLDSLNREN